MIGDYWDFVKGYTGRPNTEANRKLFCRELKIYQTQVNDDNVKELCNRWYDLTISPITKKENIMGEPMDDYKKTCDSICNYRNRMQPAPTNPKSEELQRRDYLINRLYEVRGKRRAEYEKTFKIHELPPTTVKDLIARIEQGKYMLPDDETIAHMEDIDRGPLSIIRWRDPNYPAETEKFDEAMKKDEVRFQLAKDSITAGSIDSILRAFTTYLEEVN